MSTTPDITREVLALVRDSLKVRRGEVADDSWIEERARNLTAALTLEFEVIRPRCRFCLQPGCDGFCAENWVAMAGATQSIGTCAHDGPMTFKYPEDTLTPRLVSTCMKCGKRTVERV